YPAERIAYMLQDSVPRVVLTENSTHELAGDTARVNIEQADWLGSSGNNPCVAALDAQKLAYVIYTSG
ncbi:hypothetical protein, partial [Pseudomonas syringae]|uniref:hypothetical protein n=1 Tax=Pseudomonas syringae TaxID=317 RepID=UPI001F071ED5